MFFVFWGVCLLVAGTFTRQADKEQITGFAALGPTRYPAEMVALVVEIVSPSTKRIDRTIKPPMHAEADIPWYWRLEPEQHQLIGYQLRNYEYIEVQRISSGPDTAVANPFGLIVMDPSKLVKQR